MPRMASKTQSDRPFVETLLELLEEQEISQRELIRRTRRHGWGSPGTISLLVNGDLEPTMRAMEAIAQALGIDPAHFAEHRLATARRRLDPAVVGLADALRALERFDP